jgi:Ran GTPase-activating protein (RanGAP) involved in mRNA processing and transport
LQDLDLSHNPLGEAGVINVCASLQHHSHLKCLDLGFSGMKDEGAKHLAEVLSGMSDLKKIRLGGNDLSIEGAIQILPFLLASPQIDELQHTEIAGNAGQLIATALRLHGRHCACLSPS